VLFGAGIREGFDFIGSSALPNSLVIKKAILRPGRPQFMNYSFKRAFLLCTCAHNIAKRLHINHPNSTPTPNMQIINLHNMAYGNMGNNYFKSILVSSKPPESWQGRF